MKISICLSTPGVDLPEKADTIVIPTAGYTVEGKTVHAEEDSSFILNDVFTGILIRSESVDDAIRQLVGVNVEKYKAAILLLGNGTRAIETAYSLRQTIGDLPICGGVGAGADDSPLTVPLITLALIEDDVPVEHYNLHEELEAVRVTTDGTRLLTVDGLEALEWYEKRCRELGLDEINMEALTLSNDKGKNIHFSLEDGKVIGHTEYPSGGEMRERFLHPDQARARFNEIIRQKGKLFFGCAGLKSMVDGELFSGDNSATCYLHGEMVDIDDHPFANLSISGIELSEN